MEPCKRIDENPAVLIGRIGHQTQFLDSGTDRSGSKTLYRGEEEVADRTAADKALSTEFTAKLNTTKQALASAVGNINTLIEPDKDNRIAGDNTL